MLRFFFAATTSFREEESQFGAPKTKSGSCDVLDDVKELLEEAIELCGIGLLRGCRTNFLCCGNSGLFNAFRRT